jgi:3-deoxy-manno-octulosonate cytidylyltransferase (CMP-KDO synthetase)
MKIVGMIPARLESSRLPEKALADIAGLPMVVHTAKRAQLARSLDAVYLATDSPRIQGVAESQGVKVIMTGSHHQTGTDRLAEAVGHVESDIIVNIQGDEPLVMPDHIDAIVQALIDNSSVNVALGATPYTKKNSPSDIKAVLDLQGDILYCSRSDLPSDARGAVGTMLKLCFIVAFRTPFLLEYASWEQTPLERIEYNEYLRILEHGHRIRAVMIEDAAISVDTPEDLEIARSIMAEDRLRLSYAS